MLNNLILAMKIKEIISDSTMPTLVAKQAKIRAFLRNVANARAFRPLTNDEKAEAIILQGQNQRRVDKDYVARLKRQLDQAIKM